VYSVRFQANPDYDAHVVRFTYTSLVTPASVIDYDMDARTWTERKRTVVHGYEPGPYRSARVHATAPDGTSVPVSLVWKEPLERNGTRPMYLLGYGAYGSSYEPAFNSPYLSLIDRGFVLGIAHVRGGEELGRAWYDDGKLLAKKNSFTDFVACAEELVTQGWTAPDRLVISGGSAGGLLMGAVVNQRPDLFAAVVMDVPFVDVVNTMLDATLPLTVIEYDEWGNPEQEAYYRYIRDYSPYDNVRAQPYPHMLVTAGFNDPRVQYWEPAKWVAKLRATRTNDTRLLLKTNMGAGHAGASGRYEYLKEVAFKYAFVLDTLGISRPPLEGKPTAVGEPANGPPHRP
jgi:oligopeptidase B